MMIKKPATNNTRADMDNLDFMRVTDKCRRVIDTAQGLAGAVREAIDLIKQKAHITAAGLCYIEPIPGDATDKTAPFVRCMDGHGDILRVSIKARGTDHQGRARYVLEFTRQMIDNNRLQELRRGLDDETSNPTREKSQGELLAQRIAETVAGIDPAIKDYIKANKSRLKLSETLRISKHFNGNKTPGYMLYFGETWLATATTYQEAVTLRRAIWINAISDRQ